MKATLTYEGKTVEVEIAEEEARKIFGEPKTGWERVKPSQYYCYISGGGLVAAEEEERDESDDLYYVNGNYFADRDLANDQARAIELWLRIKRWAAEHCKPERIFKIAWSDKKIRVWRTLGSREAFGVYFDTEAHAEQCVEEFRDDLLWYFTECRDRMDG